MAEKADVDLATLSMPEITRLLNSFGHQVDTADKLCGGYSSVNYAVRLQSGSCLLLRIAISLPEAAAQLQSRVLRAVAQSGVPCPKVLCTAGGEYVLPCRTSNDQQGFAQLHEWVDGVTANKRVAEDEAGMMVKLGSILASLHSSSPTDCGQLHVASCEYMRNFMHWPEGTTWEMGLGELGSTEGSVPLTSFLTPTRVSDLRAALSNKDLPFGIIHGDPFLDNMMVLNNEQATAVMLDWDEAATGPLVYDLACSVVGGCFDGADLLPQRVSSLLSAYGACRPLSQREVDALPELMIANAVIIAWYRWRAFHIEVADAPVEAKESYKEMIEIALSLEVGGAARSALDRVLAGSVCVH